jgi:uncharacterized protein YraI
MKLSNSTQRAMVVLVGALSTTGLTGCAAEEFELAPVEDLEMQSASETGDEITARYPAGTTARTTASLNLRSSPSTSARVILVMPSGSRVTLTDGVPQGGWYRVAFNGHNGWAFGQYLTVSSSSGGGSSGGSGSGGSATSSADFSGMLSRASAGEGFSYWWGHGRWLESGPSSSTRGSCSGSCPSCSHSGSYGADCSGFVAKVWRVPSSNSPVSVDSHPYSTYHFRNQTGGGQWSQISRGSVRPGDALVYNNGSAGHIVWVRGGDGWGAMDLYEARGCSYGIVRNTRSLGGDYVAIRRN